MSHHFEIAEKYSGSDIQCKERCKNRADCAAYAYDTALCYLMIFGTDKFEGSLNTTVEQQIMNASAKEAAANYSILVKIR